MSMLDRYKKASGGFLQLLNLIETCGPAKQEKFLAIIQQEDQVWAETIKAKMLSMDKILSWPDETVAEVCGHLQELTLATALLGLGEPVQERVFKYLAHAQQRKLRDLMGEKKPTPAEVSAAYMKIIEEVRKLMKDGYIRMEKIDPTLVIEEDIEDLLAKGQLSQMSAPAPEMAGEAEEVLHFPDSFPEPGSGGGAQAEVASLRKKLELTQKEIAHLRHENKLLKGKLEQIKKIA